MLNILILKITMINHLSFPKFLKEYSIMGNYLKEIIIINIRLSNKSIFGFYLSDRITSWHNIGNLSH